VKRSEFDYINDFLHGTHPPFHIRGSSLTSHRRWGHQI